MSKPKPILSRKLRVCFDVEVKLLPLSARRLAEAPELAALQQALVENPVLRARMLAYWALDAVNETLQGMYNADGWLNADPYDLLLDAVRQVPLSNLRRFLYEGLLHKASYDFVSDIFLEATQSQRLSQAHVTDLESSQELDWTVTAHSIFSQRDQQGRFLLAEVQGETVLCLNLSHAGGVEAVLESAASEVQTPIGSVLGFVEGSVSAGQHDDLLVRLAEAFPGLPVEIYAGPPSLSRDSEE